VQFGKDKIIINISMVFWVFFVFIV